VVENFALVENSVLVKNFCTGEDLHQWTTLPLLEISKKVQQQPK
jgi:hypothetical protein